MQGLGFNLQPLQCQRSSSKTLTKSQNQFARPHGTCNGLQVTPRNRLQNLGFNCNRCNVRGLPRKYLRSPGISLYVLTALATGCKPPFGNAYKISDSIATIAMSALFLENTYEVPESVCTSSRHLQWVASHPSKTLTKSRIQFATVAMSGVFLENTYEVPESVCTSSRHLQRVESRPSETLTKFRIHFQPERRD